MLCVDLIILFLYVLPLKFYTYIVKQKIKEKENIWIKFSFSPDSTITKLFFVYEARKNYELEIYLETRNGKLYQKWNLNCLWKKFENMILRWMAREREAKHFQRVDFVNYSLQSRVKQKIVDQKCEVVEGRENREQICTGNHNN